MYVAKRFLCTLHNSLNWLYVILRLFVGSIFAVVANKEKPYLLNRFGIWLVMRPLFGQK